MGTHFRVLTDVYLMDAQIDILQSLRGRNNSRLVRKSEIDKMKHCKYLREHGLLFMYGESDESLWIEATSFGKVFIKQHFNNGL